MRICILVPSLEYIEQAGARIRYKRILAYVNEFDTEIELTPIQEFTKESDFKHDIYIISKCYDARAIIVAQKLHKTNKVVGVDLFDEWVGDLLDAIDDEDGEEWLVSQVIYKEPYAAS